jgi:hypothetical protein
LIFESERPRPRTARFRIGCYARDASRDARGRATRGPRGGRRERGREERDRRARRRARDWRAHPRGRKARSFPGRLAGGERRAGGRSRARRRGRDRARRARRAHREARGHERDDRVRCCGARGEGEGEASAGRDAVLEGVRDTTASSWQKVASRRRAPVLPWRLKAGKRRFLLPRC